MPKITKLVNVKRQNSSIDFITKLLFLCTLFLFLFLFFALFPQYLTNFSGTTIPCCFRKYVKLSIPYVFYTSQMLHILEIEGKTFHQQKDYNNWLYGNSRFIAVVWNWTHSISKVFLYISPRGFIDEIGSIVMELMVFWRHPANPFVSTIEICLFSFYLEFTGTQKSKNLIGKRLYKRGYLNGQ